MANDKFLASINFGDHPMIIVGPSGSSYRQDVYLLDENGGITHRKENVDFDRLEPVMWDCVYCDTTNSILDKACSGCGAPKGRSVK